MDRRGFLWTAGAGLVWAVFPAGRAAADVHLKELIALTKKAPKESVPSIRETAEQASALGWTCPTSGKDMHWIGKWNLITNKGEKAQVTALKGGEIQHDGGAKPWFTKWSALTKPGEPMLMVLSDGQKDVWFQYYERPGVAFLSNYANRKQFMTFTMRS